MRTTADAAAHGDSASCGTRGARSMSAARDRAVFYALGGGSGHLARSLVVARRYASALVFHRAARAPEAVAASVRLARVPDAWSFAEVREALAAELRGGAELVVDSFPGGLGHELDDELLALATGRTLVRRYVVPGTYVDYTALAARFDRVLAPYPPGASEWEDPDPRDEPIGHAVRALRVAPGPAAPLAVIGDEAALLPGLRACLPGERVRVRGPFEELPPARAYLAIGAGYNMAYELLAAGVDFRLVPEERRYDDQFRRSALLGRGVTSRADLHAWLASLARGRAA